MYKLYNYSAADRDFYAMDAVRDCCIENGFYEFGCCDDYDLLLSAARGCAHLVHDEYSFHRYIVFLTFDIYAHSNSLLSVISDTLSDKLFPVFFEKVDD